MISSLPLRFNGIFSLYTSDSRAPALAPFGESRAYDFGYGLAPSAAAAGHAAAYFNGRFLYNGCPAPAGR